MRALVVIFCLVVGAGALWYFFLDETGSAPPCPPLHAVDPEKWARQMVTLEPAAAAAPDGGGGTVKVVETAVAGQHAAFLVASANMDRHTLSAFVKAGERTAVRIGFSGRHVDVDLASGQITRGEGTVTAHGDGWYRVSVSAVPSSKTHLNFYPLLGDTETYEGDGTSGFYLWGVHFEKAETACVYAPLS